MFKSKVRDANGSEKGGQAWLHVSIVTMLLLCSVCINVLLARKVSQLRNTLAALKSQGQLAVGAAVPPIVAKDLDGKEALLSYPGIGEPTIIYVFTPQCGWCTRNLEGMKALADGVRGKYRFVGLSLSSEGLREYAARHDLDFPIYTDIPGDIRSAYKLGGTPQTIVVSSGGRVEKTWTGAYTPDIQKEVEKFFTVSLPVMPSQN